MRHVGVSAIRLMLAWQPSAMSAMANLISAYQYQWQPNGASAEKASRRRQRSWSENESNVMARREGGAQ